MPDGRTRPAPPFARCPHAACGSLGPPLPFLLAAAFIVNPWIKRIALASGALLLVLLAGAGWLLARFDAEQTKRLLTDWVQEHRQRTLAIDGPLTLRVFPRLELGLSQLRLSEKDRPDEFLRVEEARLAVQLWPLLRRQLRVDRVELAGMRLRYTRDARGRSNIDDLLAPDKKESADAGPDGEALDFDVAAVKVQRLQLSIADAATPLHGEVQLRSLRTGRLAPGVETPVQLAATLALRQPQVAGELTLDTTAKLEPAQANLALRELALGWRGEALGVKDMELTLSGDLQRDGASGALQARDLQLDFDATTGGLRLEDSTLGLARLDWQAAQRALTLEGLALQLQGRQADKPLSFAIEWPELQVAGERIQGSPLSGKFSLGGEQPLQAEFRSAAPGGSFEQLRLAGFKATLSSPGAARKVRGSVAADLLIQPARQVLALEPLALQLTLEQPQMQPLAIEAQGRAQASAQAADWRLGGLFNGTRFSTDGSAAWAGDTPRLKLQGDFAALDLNRLLPAPAPASSQPAPPSSGSADTPVDLSGLRGLQAQVSLKAERLVARQFDLHNARLDATLEQGMLRVSRLAGGTWGGQIEAQAFADARAQRVTLRGEARGIQLEPALQALAQNDQLEGTGRVTLDLETAGHSVQEMKSRLAGSAAAQLRDGAIKGINLARALRNAKAALSMREDAVQKASRTEKTDFSELNASFRIAEGVAHNQDLEMKSPFLRVGGEGRIDIGRSRLDYTVRAMLAGTSKGQGGAELEALRGLTVPVQLSGPLEAPQWKIVWSDVAAGAAQATLKNQLEEKLQDKLRERLGAGTPAAAPASAASRPASPKEALKQQLLKELFK